MVGNKDGINKIVQGRNKSDEINKLNESMKRERDEIYTMMMKLGWPTKA